MEPSAGAWSRSTYGATSLNWITLSPKKPSIIHSSSIKSSGSWTIPLHARRLTVLILCRSYAGDLSCFESLSVTVPSCPGDTSTLVLHNPWLWQSFCPLFLKNPWALAKTSITGVMFGDWALFRYLFVAFWPVVTFCISHCPLHRETFLMRSEGDTNNVRVERFKLSGQPDKVLMKLLQKFYSDHIRHPWFITYVCSGLVPTCCGILGEDVLH